jgi:cytoskeletal protein CcmA (bactofilin family)
LTHPSKKLFVVEKGMTIDGSVSYEGRLVINGTVKGTLVGDHILIEEGGVVAAETRAVSIIIGGTYRGKLTVSGKLVLLSTANCSGMFQCHEIDMEPGALLNGDVLCSRPPG